MKLSDLTPESIQGAIAAFYKELSDHVAGVVFAVARARYSIPRERRRMGAAEFQYYFAADLDLLFRYALGGAEASVAHVEGMCAQVLDLLHAAPRGRVAEDWAELSRTPLGVAILACRARIRLRDDEGQLTAAEVVLLSGLTPQKLTAAKLKSRKRGAETVYPAPEVRALFEKEGVRV
jgi:hypothetical protein